jgi:hypothetical protein
VQLEELGKLKKFFDLIGNQNCDLPSCSIVPQPTTPLYVQYIRSRKVIFTVYVMGQLRLGKLEWKVFPS